VADVLDRIKAALADRYVIERELGAGGMAIVYLAEDLRHRRQVAIKVLRPELDASIGAARFLREIEIAAKLNHPHILPLLDAGSIELPSAVPPFHRSAELLYYTMPHIEGESLRDRLDREKQLSLDDALQITKEVADALGYAHSQGLVHRDIKPENILFQAGHAVVSDFGIARAVSSASGARLTETGLAVGTPAYMSPEQAAGDQDIDARSDLYGLGCVLYEMLSGDAPYTASTPQALIAKKLAEPTPRISVVRETVPASVEAALVKALEKTPADRFATAQQFVEALTAPGGGITQAERVAGVPAERAGKRPAWQWLAGLAAVAVIVAVGAVLLQGGRSTADSEAGVDEIERLVVTPFENRTGDPASDDWGLVAAEYVTRSVERASVVTVVPASTVRDLVRDVDPAVGMSLEEIVRRTGARYAVAGSYSAPDGRVRFDVEVTDARTGDLLRALDPVSGAVDSLEDVVTLLAERVAAATVVSPEANPDFATWSSPPSMEVVRAQLAAQDLFCRMRWQEVIDQVQPLLRVAPDYGPLVIMALYSYGNLGRLREADSVIAFIEPRMDRLTTSERFLVDWFQGVFFGDPAKERRAAEQLFRIQPGSYGYHAGWTALGSNRFADAIERFLAQDLDTPCYRLFALWWRDAAMAYHVLGRYEEELDLARRGREQFPSYRPLIWCEGLALAGLGRMDAVDSLLDVIDGLPLRPGYSPGMQMTWIGLELKVLGLRESYEAVMDRALAWFAAQPASELRYHRGRTFYYAERWADADTMFAALIAELPDNFDYRGHRGVALAHLERREEALEIDRWLEQFDSPYQKRFLTRWRAAIAAALGDKVQAVQLLEQAIQEGMDLGYFQRRDPEWETLRDYPPYRELMRPRG
jgi:tRNA A-37 threonylcarbamoyl transferase component Bud32/TolB-like protein